VTSSGAEAAPGYALEVVHLSVVLGGRLIVDDVSLSFAADRTHAVIGRSGAGKSVLMKAVAGLLPLAAGAVHVRRPPLVFVHQDPALLDTLDVGENVAFAVERQGIPAAEARARVEQALFALALAPLRHAAPSSLPVAAQKRVALARALCLRPGVLVVDEPTTGLDPREASAVDEALASVTGTTLIVITHSPRTVARLRPEIVVVEAGRAAPAAPRAA
jgi:ABC-type transporter Mla maintaining outer membrane lipid asymmetry ATPase subunit MlaF